MLKKIKIISIVILSIVCTSCGFKKINSGEKLVNIQNLISLNILRPTNRFSQLTLKAITHPRISEHSSAIMILHSLVALVKHISVNMRQVISEHS